SAEVRLLLEFFDDEAIGAPVDLPVDVARIVAGHVGAVIRELHGLAVVRALMHARDDALDDHPRPQLESADPREDLRVVEPFVLRHGLGPRAPPTGWSRAVVR